MHIVVRRPSLSRRKLLSILAASPVLASQSARALEPGIRQGRLRQSVMPQVWGGLALGIEERCEVLAALGFAGMDLPQPNELAVLEDYGLTPAMMTGTGTTFADGLIRRELHDQIEEATRTGIDVCVAGGCPNLIALPGERRGMSREEGAEHAVEILSRVAPYAEEKGVNVCMEITNSRIEADNRTDQVFDDIHWGFDVCRRTGSPNITVVYDIYHVQIANGDIVRTMRDNLGLISHVHVAGVPSRAEIDLSELDYRYIGREIADMGYDGFVAQEYTPSPGRNPLISLAVGYDILTV
ncbi:MAG TPA: TIM barrel protein [Gammaproteobacteria bacterium]|nr:TIM barrel protein [Gammaproteobacteria bacterium]